MRRIHIIADKQEKSLTWTISLQTCPSCINPIIKQSLSYNDINIRCIGRIGRFHADYEVHGQSRIDIPLARTLQMRDVP